MSDISLPGLHQVEVGCIVLLIHQQLVHTNHTRRHCDHGQARLPGLLLVPHVQLSEQLLCKTLHAGMTGDLPNVAGPLGAETCVGIVPSMLIQVTWHVIRVVVACIDCTATTLMICYVT